VRVLNYIIEIDFDEIKGHLVKSKISIHSKKLIAKLQFSKVLQNSHEILISFDWMKKWDTRIWA